MNGTVIAIYEKLAHLFSAGRPLSELVIEERRWLNISTRNGRTFHAVTYTQPLAIPGVGVKV